MLEQPTLTHSPRNPDDKLKRLRERVAEQAAIIEGQTATIEQMHERIQELEARLVRLAKGSCNSSRPPSSDSPFKKPPPRSRRQPGGRKPGGQPGRRGVTRSLVDDPDQCVIIPLPGTCVRARRHRDRHRCPTSAPPRCPMSWPALGPHRAPSSAPYGCRSVAIVRETRNRVRPISGFANNGDAPVCISILDTWI